ncbi:hypothetical protein D3C87_226860 [compost metagenome]
MTQQNKIKNILINENAYFYQKTNNIPLSTGKIISVFREVSSVKLGRYLLNEVKIDYNSGGQNIIYSICVFRYSTPPTFIEKYISGWEEVKIAYLLIVEYDDFVVISRKNISKIQDFLKVFKPLSYDVLSTLFVDDDTSFEKFSLKNLNVSDKAVREKSMEALDLKQNFSALGASSYILNSLRVKNNDEKTSMILNSSRINKFGKKNNIEAFCDWSKQIVYKIKSHVVESTFLSIFAEPQDYEQMRVTLVPISVLFNFGDIYNDFEAGRITRVFIRIVSGNEILERTIDPFLVFTRVERLNNVGSYNGHFLIENPFVDDFELKLNEQTITLRSAKLRKILILKDNGTEISLIDYLNSHNAFIVNFENIDLVYSNRKLFRDSKLLGNTDNFLKMFTPYAALQNVTQEKGAFTPTSTAFELGSEFRFVEDTFGVDQDFLICDDLGREWTDHIGIRDNKVVFYHSKYNTSNASASAFQDIVGQAQKNLGNLSAQEYRLQAKKDFWGTDYVSSTGVQTKIARLRKGTTVDDAIKQFTEAVNNPNFKKDVVLVINFISKASLTLWLQNLKYGVDFTEKNEAIQILWFISSLISSCYEAGAGITVCCKP